MSLVLWLTLAACRTGPAPTWSAEKVVSGVFSRLDKDADGVVRPAELWREGPSLASMDQNKSGGLSPAELLAGIQAQDPSAFDDRPGRPGVSVTRWRSVLRRSPEVRTRWELLRFLVIEAELRSPQTPLPSAAEVTALSEAGGPAYVAAQVRLEAALAATSPQGARQ
jgi:hypothetical protein